jgi:hypothetical protein
LATSPSSLPSFTLETTPLENTHVRQNFATLCHAIRAGDAALLQLKNDLTHDTILALCAVNRLEAGQFEYLPIAQMIDPPLAPLLLPLLPDAEGTWHLGAN